VRWLLLVVAVPGVLLAGGLLLNRPPLIAPPGPWERLKTYLTTNVAETRPDHRFPELRPPLLPATLEEARAAVLAAMEGLGWQEVRMGGDALRALVVTPLFRFRDEVTVRLEATGEGTRLHARSASRVGRGDLAANTRHLLDLFAALEAEGSRRD
jgi:uncharacterized protein (DUF1499 family)